MELRQLEYFVAVAEEANFTRAAARVRVSQPGVSAQIRQLERELGQTLLDRSSRTVRLTDVGSAVLPYARAVLQNLAGARQVVHELTGLVRGRVAVGMVVSCGSLDLPKLLAEYHRRYPAVEVTLSEANSDQLVRGLAEGRLDVALIGIAGKPPPGIESQVIVDEVLVAAVGRGDPWASRSSIALQLLQGRGVISLPQGTGIRSCLDSACAAARIRPQITFEASNPILLAELASRGLGVAILPQSVAASRARDLHVMAITHPVLRSRIELAWRSEAPLAPAARIFIEQARVALEPRKA